MPDLFIAKKTKPQEEKEILKHNQSPTESDGKNLSLTTSFCEFPKGVKFENQEPHEVIHLFLRRHFITNLRWVLTTLILIPIPIAVFFILPTLSELFDLPINYITILSVFYYVILIGYAFINYISWFYNVGIVTNLRVIDVDVSNISSKNVASTSITDIVDVEYSQNGVFANFFDYGNVQMQTEGLKPNFEFLSIPHPAKATDIINDLMREAKNE